MAPGVAGGAVAGLGGECRHGNADLLRNLTLAAMAVGRQSLAADWARCRTSSPASVNGISQSRQRPRLICLDAAGTLFRVRGSVGAIYAEHAVAHGLPPRPDLGGLLETRFRQGFAAMSPPGYRAGDRGYNDRADREWWRRLVARVMDGLGPLAFEAFFDAVFDVFAEPSVWKIYPEVPGVLADLRRAGLRLAIVSNFDARLLPVCRGLGLDAAVDAIVIAADAGVGKPGPGIFHAALRRFGMPADAALHVGDSAAEDVEGALAAGLRAVHLQRPGTAPAEVPPGVPVIQELGGLPAVIGV
jgi:putative hydrolase of the HAD superfamily